MTHFDYANYGIKPFAYASAWLKKTDDEISQKMLELTLKGKMPRIYDNMYVVVENPTLAQFKEYLNKSEEVRKEWRTNRIANKAIQKRNGPIINQIYALQAEIYAKEAELKKLKEMKEPSRRAVVQLVVTKK